MKSIDLSGKWLYRLDPNDLGIDEKWFDSEISKDLLNLPGTLCENGVGEPFVYDHELNPENVRSLKAKFDYVGACWYQKKISIPKELEGKELVLFLERIIIKSEIWIDDKYVGNTSGLVTAHKYDISSFVKAGTEHTLTILIDNRDTFYLSTYGHSYTNESQTIWNGIVGDISLKVNEKVNISEMLIITETDNKSVLLKGKIKSENCAKVKVDFSINDESFVVCEDSITIDISESVQSFEHRINIDKEVVAWDEFTPKLYSLASKVFVEDKFVSEKVETFGFRKVTTKDRDILLNNNKIYLRGNLECCVHPLTGYPPCDVDYWTKIFETVKEYGMNHIRYHSNCPPEAAFIAADKVGVYLQVEGPVWLDTWFMALGSHQEHYEFMPLEAERIMRAYSNHPSFVIFCNGNEFRGDFSILHNIVESSRKIRPDIIYTLTSNYDRELDPEDDIFIAVEADKKGMRGNRFFEKMATTILTDYSGAVESRNIPLVAHEGGQYAVYPNVLEIPKYNGNLEPINFMAIRDDLEKKNISHMVEKFVKASGDFSARLYKEEIESYMRTIDYAGFQILGIQDFPGQCTATIGLLDSFWDSKGLITPQWFKQFCNDVVLLIRSDKRIYNSKEKFSAEVMVNQFSNKDIVNDRIVYKLLYNDKVIGSGVFENDRLECHRQIIVGMTKEIDLSVFDRPTQLKFVVELENSQYRNDWDIWVFPEIDEKRADESINKYGIKVYDAWSEEVETMLEKGEKVLLIPKREAFVNRPTYDGSFYPVFWSPVFFKKKIPCGFYTNKEHKAFGHFVTGEYSNYQWFNLLKTSYNFDVDNLPKDFTPIVETVPNYYFNHRMTNLIEAKVGKGVLMICSLQLDELNDYNEAKWFKYSLVEYLGNVNSSEVQEISMKMAREIIVSEEELVNDDEKASKENFIN